MPRKLAGIAHLTNTAPDVSRCDLSVIKVLLDFALLNRTDLPVCWGFDVLHCVLWWVLAPRSGSAASVCGARNAPRIVHLVVQFSCEDMVLYD